MNIKKIIFIILIILWMAIVFKFSSQKSDKSSNTSGKITEIIVKIFPSAKEMNDEQKLRLIETWDPIIRKLAHFSLYTLGGIFIMGFASTYDIKTKFKIIYSLIFGILYASSDEFHQLFVEGRSCEFRDVCIDSAGILLGIMIVLLISKIILSYNIKIQ